MKTSSGGWVAQLGLVKVNPLSVPPSSGAAWDNTEYNYIIIQYRLATMIQSTSYIDIKTDFMTR